MTSFSKDDSAIILACISRLAKNEDAADVLHDLLAAERAACAATAREFAGHYPKSSDGWNTLILLAEWIENR